MHILSIDIDYAFSPGIEAYDDHIIGSRISLAEQVKINSELKLPTPRINPVKLNYLKSIFNTCKDDAPLIIIKHHHQILEYLPTTPFHLYNVDHHHDIFYPDWHELDKLDEGNWISHIDSNLIESYTWIRNATSEDIDRDVNIPFVHRQLIDPDINILPRFDQVFICISPHWTGEKDLSSVLKIIS
jgi:hypothetical protein